MIFGHSSFAKNKGADSLTLHSISRSTSGRIESKSEISSEIHNESWISVMIPLVNLAISLIIGIYMFPVILQASTGMLSK